MPTQRRLGTVLVLVLIAILLALPQAAATARTEERNYIGDAFTVYGIRLNQECDGDTPLPSAFGQVCFSLKGGEVMVRVQIQDDNHDNVYGVLNWTPGAGSTTFCNDSLWVPIPAGTTRVHVSVGGDPMCGPDSGAGGGDVIAGFV